MSATIEDIKWIELYDSVSPGHEKDHAGGVYQQTQLRESEKACVDGCTIMERKKVPLNVHVICHKAKWICKRFIDDAEEGEPDKFPTVLRQQMENEFIYWLLLI